MPAVVVHLSEAQLAFLTERAAELNAYMSAMYSQETKLTPATLLAELTEQYRREVGEPHETDHSTRAADLLDTVPPPS